MKNIKVLHITPDDKFFDGVIDYFEDNFDFQNMSIAIVDSENDKYNFKYIKQVDKVIPLYKKCDIINVLSLYKYDIIYFHSLSPYCWWMFKYIPKKVTIIWWGWGFELYQSYRCLKPLINIKLYKPLTNRLYLCNHYGIKTLLRNFYYSLLYPMYKLERKKILSRIDYYQPVLGIEYELLKRYKSFKAKEFYLPPRKMDIINENYTKKKEIGWVLIGNSATYTNNHLDIIDKLKDIKINNRNFLLPFNYGDSLYATIVKDRINKYDGNFRFISDFIPLDEYWRLIDECSYAVFGVMRQQAMGNIYYCLKNGIKVFLYKDSIPYKYFSNKGYKVFAIEDIRANSFNEVLTEKEHIINIQAYKHENEYQNKILDKALDLITKDNL